jgi:SAM-dependent methyltransferase
MDADEANALETFEFEGFAIPEELAILTGGGGDSWQGISSAHMAAYERYCPLRSGQHILEVGCGVGRDAIPIARLQGPQGSYLGVDIIQRSISWCQGNITPRYANATFHHFDILSEFYNPTGSLTVADTSFPIGDGTIDRNILQSVFTHMFEDDIVHFLSEFRRVLRPGGLVLASFFVVDDETLAMADAADGVLTFRHPWSEGCLINDPDTPEGAIAYRRAVFDRILDRGGMTLDQPVHLGSWSGRTGVPDGQDIAILKQGPEAGPWKRLRRRLGIRGS